MRTISASRAFPKRDSAHATRVRKTVGMRSSASYERKGFGHPAIRSPCRHMQAQCCWSRLRSVAERFPGQRRFVVAKERMNVVPNAVRQKGKWHDPSQRRHRQVDKKVRSSSSFGPSEKIGSVHFKCIAQSAFR